MIFRARRIAALFLDRVWTVAKHFQQDARFIRLFFAYVCSNEIANCAIAMAKRSPICRRALATRRLEAGYSFFEALEQDCQPSRVALATYDQCRNGL